MFRQVNIVCTLCQSCSQVHGLPRDHWRIGNNREGTLSFFLTTQFHVHYVFMFLWFHVYYAYLFYLFFCLIFLFFYFFHFKEEQPCYRRKSVKRALIHMFFSSTCYVQLLFKRYYSIDSSRKTLKAKLQVFLNYTFTELQISIIVRIVTASMFFKNLKICQ